MNVPLCYFPLIFQNCKRKHCWLKPGIGSRIVRGGAKETWNIRRCRWWPSFLWLVLTGTGGHGPLAPLDPRLKTNSLTFSGFLNEHVSKEVYFAHTSYWIVVSFVLTVRRSLSFSAYLPLFSTSEFLRCQIYKFELYITLDFIWLYILEIEIKILVQLSNTELILF